MTERERWVVYPLLFLALGAALRDKLVDRTTTRSIVCQELTVVEEAPLGNQPGRVLAKIGRTERTSSSPSVGYLVLNGQLEVVDRDPTEQPARSLVKLGRTEPAAGNPVSGYAVVNGQLLVNGAINAYQYAFQGHPFMPAFQAVPGITLPDLLRALQQQSLEREKRPGAPGAEQPKTSPPQQSRPAAKPGTPSPPQSKQPEE